VTESVAEDDLSVSRSDGDVDSTATQRSRCWQETETQYKSCVGTASVGCRSE